MKNKGHEIIFIFLSQGNFFQNIGSIILFAVVGTLISALIVGGGVYLLGQVSYWGKIILNSVGL